MTQVEVEGLTQRREDAKIGKRVGRGWEEAIHGMLEDFASWRLERSGRDIPGVTSSRLAPKIDGRKSHYFRSHPSALAQASLLNIFS